MHLFIVIIESGSNNQHVFPTRIYMVDQVYESWDALYSLSNLSKCRILMKQQKRNRSIL